MHGAGEGAQNCSSNSPTLAVAASKLDM